MSCAFHPLPFCCRSTSSQESAAPRVWEYRILPLTLFKLDLHVGLHPLTQCLPKAPDILQADVWVFYLSELWSAEPLQQWNEWREEGRERDLIFKLSMLHYNFYWINKIVYHLERVTITPLSIQIHNCSIHLSFLWLHSAPMTVKDVLQSLVDDNMVDCEKVGTSNYFWAFPSKALHARKRKLEELQKQVSLNTIWPHRLWSTNRAEEMRLNFETWTF